MYPRNILDRGPRLESTESDNLRHMAILLPHIGDDIAAPVLADVDVDVGVFRPVWIREPFEEQPVLHRASVGKAEDIADHGAYAGTAGVCGNAALVGPVDEVPDDQEVRADVLVRKDCQFPLEPVADVLCDAIFAVSPDQTRLTKVAECVVATRLELFGSDIRFDVRIERMKFKAATERFVPLAWIFAPTRLNSVRTSDPDDRCVALGEIKLYLATFGDRDCVLNGLGKIGEEVGHLLR